MGKSPFRRFNMSRMWICILPPKPPAFHVVAQARILSRKEGEKYGTGNPSRTQRPPWMDTELLDMVAYNANPPATFPISRTSGSLIHPHHQPDNCLAVLPSAGGLQNCSHLQLIPG